VIVIAFGDLRHHARRQRLVSAKSVHSRHEISSRQVCQGGHRGLGLRMAVGSMTGGTTGSQRAHFKARVPVRIGESGQRETGGQEPRPPATRSRGVIRHPGVIDHEGGIPMHIVAIVTAPEGWAAVAADLYFLL